MGDIYTNPPQSRNEAILRATIDGTEYTDPPQSRIEDLLLELKEAIEEGGHDESATRASIAPTESDSAHASKNIAVGEQFYLSDDKLYTATSAIAQNAAIIVYPTANYNCRVSDSVTGQIQAQEQLLEDTVGWNGKNYFKNVMTNAESLGITFTRLEDGTSECNGDATSAVARACGTFVCKANVSYILSGCPSGGGTETSDYWLGAYINGTVNEKDTGDGVLLQYNTDTEIEVKIRLPKANFNHIQFKPMIRSAEIIDSAYVPYHASVADSLDDKADNSVIGTVEGANASKAWSVGEHFIKDGQFKEVTNPIESGEAINSGNTTNKPIADSLTTTSQEVSLANEATSAGIELVTGHTNVLIDGNIKVANLRLKFGSDLTLTNDLSIIRNMPYCKAMDYHKYIAHSQTKPYSVQSWSGYIFHNSIVIPNGATITAGQYDINLVYI